MPEIEKPDMSTREKEAAEIDKQDAYYEPMFSNDNLNLHLVESLECVTDEYLTGDQLNYFLNALWERGLVIARMDSVRELNEPNEVLTDNSFDIKAQVEALGLMPDKLTDPYGWKGLYSKNKYFGNERIGTRTYLNIYLPELPNRPETKIEHEWSGSESGVEGGIQYLFYGVINSIDEWNTILKTTGVHTLLDKLNDSKQCPT